MKVEKCLRNNGWPQKFIEKYGRCEDKQVKETIINKNILLLKCDYITGTVNRRLKTTLKRTYFGAKLVILCKAICL